MSGPGNNDRQHGGPGLEVAAVALLVVGVLLRESAGPAAHAIAHELTSGIPVVDLPFKLLLWVWDHTFGDIKRELLSDRP